MSSRPSEYLNWVPGGAAPAVVEPPSGQKTTGWLGGEAPPYDYENWIVWLIDSWIQYLDGEINSASSVVLTTTGNTTTSSNQLTNLASTTNLAVGQVISMANVPAGTQVKQISGSTVTMTRNATGNNTAAAVTFNNKYALGGTLQLQIDQLDEAIVSHFGAYSGGNTAASSLITITEASDGVIYVCDTTGGAFNCQLAKPGSFKDMKFSIFDKNGNFGTAAVTLVLSASEKINGLSSNLALQANYGRWTVSCDGTDWYVL